MSAQLVALAIAQASDACNRRGVPFWRGQPVMPLFSLLGFDAPSPVPVPLRVRFAVADYRCKSCSNPIARGDHYAAAFSVPVRLCLDCVEPAKEGRR